MNIEQILDGIIQREGREFTHDPADSGGPTRFGITLAVLSDYMHRAATVEDVRSLTEARAREIYRELYITRPGFRALLGLWVPIGEEVIDAGVNCGVHRATEWLQRSLNALNRNARDWPDLAVDGRCGAHTVAAVRALLTVRGARGVGVLLRALNVLQGAHYIELAEKRPKDEAFLFGWLDNRVRL